MNTLVKILSVLILVIGIIINPAANNSYVNKSICPFQPPVDDQILGIMEQHYIPNH